MSGIHSVLSPSKAPMILRCAAALAAGKNVPNPPSEYAAEGSAYHAVAENALRLGKPCDAFVGEVFEVDGFKFTIDEENAAHAQSYVDAIRRIPGMQLYEVRLDTSNVTGVVGQGGTADAVSLDFDTYTIHVDDLKFGRGEIVHAFENEQLMTYAAAALEKYDILHDWNFVKIGIHQPRLHHYSEHTYHVEKLLEWVAASRPRFQLAHKLYQDPTLLEERHFVPTEKGCRWCPVRGSCAARSRKVLDMFPVAPTGAVKAPAATRMTDTALGEARDRAEEIEQWVKDVKEEAHRRAIAGRAIPGWKLVAGRRGNRKWTDEEFAESAMADVLLDSAYQPRKIISPADAEKKLKKEHVPTWTTLQGYIEQSEGGLSLERESVSKPAVDRPMVEFPVQEPLA